MLLTERLWTSGVRKMPVTMMLVVRRRILAVGLRLCAGGGLDSKHDYRREERRQRRNRKSKRCITYRRVLQYFATYEN